MRTVFNARVIVICYCCFFAGQLASPYNSNWHPTVDLGETGKTSAPDDYDRFYLFFAKLEPISTESTEMLTTEETESLSKGMDPDPLSVVWYLGAFSGLIIFFLVVTFSEWCCASKHLYHNGGQAPPPYSMGQGNRRGPETPPPPYHLFAPPEYTEAAEKAEPIYIIPVHNHHHPLPVVPLRTE